METSSFRIRLWAYEQALKYDVLTMVTIAKVF